ncbi:CRISPR-associated protein [Pseudanabaena minima]|uniref:CRISPR-associated protein n=1 Tax=Pseudanabaena minima TaxID=890415 RepID=UPI003DA9E8E4
MFKYLIVVRPLGFLYGSAGAFLSPENLVGRSGAKFPPDAATLSGLIIRNSYEQQLPKHQELKKNLVVAGAFWAKDNKPQNFYVPMPRSLIIGEEKFDEWKMSGDKWDRDHNKSVESDYKWMSIHFWKNPQDGDEPLDADTIFNNRQNDINKDKNVIHSAAKPPWKFVSILHPTLEHDQRHVRLPKDADDRGSLFLENAVQMDEDSCLVYLSTHSIADGWYRFGGENHMVEIISQKLEPNILSLLAAPIKRSFALICPAVWGTNNLSVRYPQAFKACDKPPKMLTDRPVTFRYRMGSNLGIGRYAVPAGTVYVLKHPLDQEHDTWWKFPKKWFPQSDEGKDFDKRSLPLKHLGCGLCLPITIKGVD